MRKLMNKKAGIGVMVLLITICFVPAMAGAFAQGGGERGKGFTGKGHHRSALGIWRSPQIVEDLALTDEQVGQLRDLDFNHREKQQASKAELDKLRLEMDKAFTAKNVDRAAVRQTAEKMADVKGRMFIEMTEARLAVQNVLNADQLEKLNQYRRYHKRQGYQRGQEQMKGRRWAQNQDCPRFSDNSAE